MLTIIRGRGTITEIGLKTDMAGEKKKYGTVGMEFIHIKMNK